MGKVTTYSSLLLALVVTGCAISSANSNNKYKLKPRELTHLPDALRELRMFLDDSVKIEERCERYAVLLSSFKKYTLDQHWIADLALQDPKNLRRQFSSIGIDSLRLNYIEAIDTYMATQVDRPMIDLHDCLVVQFGNFDAKVRSFLNQNSLTKAMEQYRAFLKTPLRLFLQAGAQHPTLKREDLYPAVSAAILQSFNGDQRKFESHFGSRYTGQAVVTAQPEVVPGPAVSVAATALADQLSPEEQQYISQISGALAHLYETLPLDTSHGLRCGAYSRLIEADPSQLNEQLVKSLIVESANIPDKKSASLVFQPGEKIRWNFLLTLDLIDPEFAGAGVWLDMMGCVNQWQAIDARAAKLLNDPEKKRLVEFYTSPPQPQSKSVAEQPPATQSHVAPTANPQAAAPVQPQQQAARAPVGPEPTRTPVAATQLAPKRVEPQPAEAQKRATPTAAPAQVPVPLSIAPSPAETMQALQPEEQAYMNQVYATLNSVYQTLPIDAKLIDRCQVYGKVIDAEPQKLGAGLVEFLVKEVGDRLALLKGKPQSGAVALEPSDVSLDNFLFALSALDPKSGENAGLWLDMMNCAAQLRPGSAIVDEFLKQPERQALLAEIIKATE